MATNQYLAASIAKNAQDVHVCSSKLEAQAALIEANTVALGQIVEISPVQAAAIVENTAKTSITSAQSDSIALSAAEIDYILPAIGAQPKAARDADFQQSQRSVNIWSRNAGNYEFSQDEDPEHYQGYPMTYSLKIPYYGDVEPVLLNKTSTTWGSYSNPGDHNETMLVRELTVDNSAAPNNQGWPTFKFECDDSGKIIQVGIYSRFLYYSSTPPNYIWRYFTESDCQLWEMPETGVIGTIRFKLNAGTSRYSAVTQWTVGGEELIYQVEVGSDLTSVVKNFGWNYNGGAEHINSGAVITHVSKVGVIGTGQIDAPNLHIDMSFDVEGAPTGKVTMVCDAGPGGAAGPALAYQDLDNETVVFTGHSEGTEYIPYVPPQTLQSKYEELLARFEESEARETIAPSSFDFMDYPGDYAVDHFMVGKENIDFQMKVLADRTHGDVDISGNEYNYIYDMVLKHDLIVNVWVPSARTDKDERFPYRANVDFPAPKDILEIPNPTPRGEYYDMYPDNFIELVTDEMGTDSSGNMNFDHFADRATRQAFLDGLPDITGWYNKLPSRVKSYPCDIEKLRNGIVETTYDPATMMAPGEHPVHFMFSGDVHTLYTPTWDNSQAPRMASYGMIVVNFNQPNNHGYNDKPIRRTKTPQGQFLDNWPECFTEKARWGDIDRCPVLTRPEDTKPEKTKYYALAEDPTDSTMLGSACLGREGSWSYGRADAIGNTHLYEKDNSDNLVRVKSAVDPLANAAPIINYLSTYTGGYINLGMHEQQIYNVMKLLNAVPGMEEKTNWTSASAYGASAGGVMNASCDATVANGGMTTRFKDLVPGTAAVPASNTRTITLTGNTLGASNSYASECSWKIWEIDGDLSGTESVDLLLAEASFPYGGNPPLIEVSSDKQYWIELADSWGDGWQNKSTSVVHNWLELRVVGVDDRQYFKRLGEDFINGGTLDLIGPDAIPLEVFGEHPEVEDSYTFVKMPDFKAIVGEDTSKISTSMGVLGAPGGNSPPAIDNENPYGISYNVARQNYWNMSNRREGFHCATMECVQSGVTDYGGTFALYPCQMAVRASKPSILKNSAMVYVPSNAHGGSGGMAESVYGTLRSSATTGFIYPTVRKGGSFFGGMPTPIPSMDEMSGLNAYRIFILEEMFINRNIFTGLSVATGEPRFSLAHLEGVGLKIDINPQTVDGCEAMFPTGLQLGRWALKPSVWDGDDFAQDEPPKFIDGDMHGVTRSDLSWWAQSKRGRKAQTNPELEKE